jgi:hypothetical protein
VLQPETVAAYLVPRVRTVVARKSVSTYIKYLTIPRALGKFLTAPTKANKYFNKQGMHCTTQHSSRFWVYLLGVHCTTQHSSRFWVYLLGVHCTTQHSSRFWVYLLGMRCTTQQSSRFWVIICRVLVTVLHADHVALSHVLARK